MSLDTTLVPWYKATSKTILNEDVEGVSAAEELMLQRVLQSNGPHCLFHAYLNGKTVVPLKDILTTITEVTGTVMRYSRDDYFYLFAGTGTYISFQFKQGGISYLNALSWETDKDQVNLAAKIKALLAKNFLVKDHAEAGVVHVLAHGNRGWEVHPLGQAGIALCPENYSPEVVKTVPGLRACLSEKNPRGRLIILSGPPGTGKTKMLQHLITVPGITVLYLPAHLVSRVTDPDFIQGMIRCRELVDDSPEKTGEYKPIVLIIEDADRVLSKRSDDNLSEVSSLLNLTDGFLGQLLDIRVLAASNVPKLEIDVALKRQGRLGYHIDIQLLSGEQATRRYRALLDEQGLEGTESFRTPTALSAVYDAAKDAGWKDFAKGPGPIEEESEMAYAKE